MLDLLIIGPSGRMGRALLEAVFDDPRVQLSGALVERGKPLVGVDPATLVGREASGTRVLDDARTAISQCDALIDFTTPEATLAFAAIAAEFGKTHIIGTTGLDASQETRLTELARSIPIVYAPNMSAALTLVMALVEKAANLLDDDYDIDIVEMHHRHKVDAPSGTALGLGRAAAKGRGVSFDEVKKLSREGRTGPRPKGEIGFATLRGGSVVGDHTVIFAGDGERVELTHKSEGRATYAKGAVRAALWAHGRAPGLYSMRDVLAL